MDIRLLIIDPQEDFCQPGNANANPPVPKGSLYVEGSEEDCKRTATMIDRLGKTINRIYITFDSHQQYQIFHPMFWMTWKDGKAGQVNPFDVITYEDIKNGEIVPVDPNMLTWCLDYTKALETGGRYPLVIWPYHCLIGTPGWNINPDIMKSVLKWEKEYYKRFYPIVKGSNFKTEHYSAVKAEVEVPEDTSTHLNSKGLIDPLEKADIVVIAGQARSHCVANTVRDIMTVFASTDPDLIKKLYILEDAMSDVTTFEHLGDSFFDDFKKAGGNITTTTKFLA